MPENNNQPDQRPDGDNGTLRKVAVLGAGLIAALAALIVILQQLWLFDNSCQCKESAA